jgi:protein TonB
MFEQSVIQPAGKSRTGYAFLISSLLQGLLLGIAGLAPLLYSNPLPMRALMSFLAAPAPPPPASAPLPRSAVRPLQKPRFDQTQLLQPTVIPRHTPILVDDDEPLARSAATWIGVPGGLGPAGGAIPTLFPEARPASPPPPAPPPARVGGDVQRAKQVYAPLPLYPPLARQQRISGVVRLNAVIAKDGTVEQLSVASGHPLLIRAAVEAVSQWRYRPTLLNGEPVEVITEIDVHFTLSQ